MGGTPAFVEPVALTRLRIGGELDISYDQPERCSTTLLEDFFRFLHRSHRGDMITTQAQGVMQ
jgi:hypothetical protein